MVASRFNAGDRFAMGGGRLIKTESIEAAEAVRLVGTENSQLHEELARIQNEHYWLVKGLQFISNMPNPAAEVAKKILGFQNYA